MDIHNFLITAADTARRKGPHDRIVMSSRVRLARNLKDAAFPGWAKKPERVRVLELLGVLGGGRVVESPLVVLPPLTQAHGLGIGGGGEGGHERDVVRREVDRPMTWEERVAVGFAVTTLIVALVFIAYALTGADLCVWCAPSP